MCPGASATQNIPKLPVSKLPVCRRPKSPPIDPPPKPILEVAILVVAVSQLLRQGSDAETMQRGKTNGQTVKRSNPERVEQIILTHYKHLHTSVCTMAQVFYYNTHLL